MTMSFNAMYTTLSAVYGDFLGLSAYRMYGKCAIAVHLREFLSMTAVVRFFVQWPHNGAFVQLIPAQLHVQLVWYKLVIILNAYMASCEMGPSVNCWSVLNYRPPMYLAHYSGRNGESMKPIDLPETVMTTEEARKVKWNSRNPRPIGELLDEGYLTRSDLIWAAERAFNPQQKQAAQVLLDELSRTPKPADQHYTPQSLPPELADSKFSVGLSMEQVRATQWPFSPYQGHQMGTLAEKQQLTLKDLGYAAENAWDERVRQAAVALLLVRLNQVVTTPLSAAGLLHVISGGRSFAERRQSVLIFFQGALWGGILGIFVTLFILSLINALSSPAKPLPPNTTPTNLIVAAIILFVLGVLLTQLFIVMINRLSIRLDKQIQSHRKGQEGEERVSAAMHSVLDGDWFLFRNIVLPGRNQGDLDFVLVGPTGVWVIEAKHYTGEYRNIGEGWEYRIGNHWKAAQNNPSRQARDNSVRLSSFLKADGIQQWVTPTVVWANPEAILTVENPSVAVWTLDRLRDELDNILQFKPTPKGTQQRIVDKLTKLCESQKQKAAK